MVTQLVSFIVVLGDQLLSAVQINVVVVVVLNAWNKNSGVP